MPLIRQRRSNEDEPQPHRRPYLDPFEVVRTPLSRAATKAMPGLEHLHDNEKVTSQARIEPGHELFPDGCDFRITSFYGRDFAAQRGTGAWMVEVRTREDPDFRRLGAVRATPLNQVGILSDRIRDRGYDGHEVLARMITAKGGDIIPDTREDLEGRQAQVTAILDAFGELSAAEAAATRAAAAGSAALHAA